MRELVRTHGVGVVRYEIWFNANRWRSYRVKRLYKDEGHEDWIGYKIQDLKDGWSVYEDRWFWTKRGAQKAIDWDRQPPPPPRQKPPTEICVGSFDMPIYSGSRMGR
jgi:hypothetical protein